jgi:phosphoadenosine phosphosulfate reductase
VGIVRLGRNVLRWCNACNLPIIEEKTCPKCGTITNEVLLTPPGDCRPAFDYDIVKIRDLADRQFGGGCGDLLLPRSTIAVLSRSPALDRMDEIVSNGEIVGAIFFDVPKGDKLILRPPAADRMLSKMKGKVVADAGALPSIGDGSNLMGPGVVSADESVEVGDEVAVLTPDGEVHATGVARKSGREMMERSRGVAVKVRWATDEKSKKAADKSNDWKLAVDANRDYIERKVQTAKNFLTDLAKRYNEPIAVSFSGGKDSLATLNLALESGLRPDILFADTGLELDETVEEVRRTAKETGLRLFVEEAGNAFWEGVELFGPPGKDFRWCCKTCKLGPTTKLITKNYPNGVVSLIGQRDYESEQRMRKGSVWINPWVPGQIGASPIQKWNSLLVWMYIFSRGLRYNPWYEKGLDRIGCYLCPSSDMAELSTVKEGFPAFSKWEDRLESYRKSRDLPESWSELGLWRWKRLPPAMRNKLNELGISLESLVPEDVQDAPLRLNTAAGYRPCTEGGYSLEGVFTRKLDLERVQNLLNIIGKVEYHKDENIARTGAIIVFGEGAVSVKEKDERTIRELTRDLEQIVIRAMFCVGCGVCAGRCKSGALTVDARVKIDPEKCIHCGECLGPCPVLRFGGDKE